MRREGTVLARWRRPTAGPLADLIKYRVYGVRPLERVEPLSFEFEKPVINWGVSSDLATIAHEVNDNWVLNWPESVKIAKNKLTTFNSWKSMGLMACPEYTTDPDLAYEWLLEGNSVVCRDYLCSNSGKGIRIINRRLWEEMGKPPIVHKSPLYTRYFRKETEFRVHVFRGIVVACAEKMRRSEQPADYWVRSHDRGWIFAEQKTPIPEGLYEEAIRAVRVLLLDFGAVDVGVKKDGTYKFFEVNTAPGLTGRTLTAWANSIKEWQSSLETF